VVGKLRGNEDEAGAGKETDSPAAVAVRVLSGLVGAPDLPAFFLFFFQFFFFENLGKLF